MYLFHVNDAFLNIYRIYYVCILLNKTLAGLIWCTTVILCQLRNLEKKRKLDNFITQCLVTSYRTVCCIGICLLLDHMFYYGNSYTKIRAICMSICTENGFCFLHCDWLYLIPLSSHLITQF